MKYILQAIISSPAWMTSLSQLIVKKIHSISAQQYERIIFALCRLDAWRIRDSIGASRTVLFSLPGQSCVPVLLPLIQKVFVHDRHVFVYDGCCPSVEFGVALQKQYGSSYRQQTDDCWEEVSSSPRVITSNFPMAPLRHIRELSESLAKVNGSQASIVESWMASVDTFLDMKSQEKKNFYAPFVCQMSFLMKRSVFGKTDVDMSEMALKNVLQYITGSKSRALPSVVMTEAVLCLNEMRCIFETAVRGSELSGSEKALIEACVFTHKAILLGDKTLMDTVQPKEDWSLKAAKKLKSCLCCSPEEDEDEENEDGELSKPKLEMDLLGPVSKYIDGKAQFAFDPTKFSK